MLSVLSKMKISIKTREKNCNKRFALSPRDTYDNRQMHIISRRIITADLHRHCLKMNSVTTLQLRRVIIDCWAETLCDQVREPCCEFSCTPRYTRSWKNRKRKDVTISACIHVYAAAGALALPVRVSRLSAVAVAAGQSTRVSRETRKNIKRTMPMYYII